MIPSDQKPQVVYEPEFDGEITVNFVGPKSVQITFGWLMRWENGSSWPAKNVKYLFYGYKSKFDIMESKCGMQKGIQNGHVKEITSNLLNETTFTFDPSLKYLKKLGNKYYI